MGLRATAATAVLVIAGVLATAPAAQAVTLVDLPETARLDEDDNMVVLKFKYACDPLPFPEGSIFLVVSVSQASGAFSNIFVEYVPGASLLRCDGRTHRVKERFPSEDGTPWQPGDLAASASLTGELFTGSGSTLVYEATDRQIIRLR